MNELLSCSAVLVGSRYGFLDTDYIDAVDHCGCHEHFNYIVPVSGPGMSFLLFVLYDFFYQCFVFVEVILQILSTIYSRVFVLVGFFFLIVSTLYSEYIIVST